MSTALSDLEQKLFDAVRRAKKWRGARSLSRQFGVKKPCAPRGAKWVETFGWVYEDEAVADALFKLVREGYLEWFGAEHDGSEPLKYRVAAGRACVDGSSSCANRRRLEHILPRNARLPRDVACDGTQDSLSQQQKGP